MSVAVLFALIGGVILVGFLANLLFRLTKIPSVLLLIAIGVVLGPVTGWIRSEALLTIAPFFGAAALLIILFEGGLELEIAHVIRHAPRTTILAVTVFGLSVAAVAALAHLLVGFSLLNALMLGAILGATSPAICLPVVAGLSVRNEVKTVIKLESAMGEVLLIVAVVLLIQSHSTGAADPMGWAWSFAKSLLVALLVSSIAGVLWSRLVGWMGREPLAYMLTLGIVCLLYFAVEELGGSTAIAVLLFGLILANMQEIAGHIGPRLGDLFGVDIREEQFVLSQFMVNITAELSFLVRTFFFVYLGLLLDFSALSWSLAAWALAIFALLLLSRRIGVGLFRRGGASFTPTEFKMIMALQPRGLATAVVAFLPMQSGVAGTSLFPVYAFVVIVLSNLYMTGGVLFAERRLKLEASAEPAESEPGPEPGPEPAAAEAALEAEWSSARDEVTAAELPAAVPASRGARLFSPAADFADEPAPTRFTDWMARFFGLRLADRETEYAEMIRASYLSEPLFWVQAFLGAAICALGLILDQTAIIIGGALIVPLVRPVIATGLALASGDIYLLVKLLVKLLSFGVMAVALSAMVVDLLPFSATTAEIAARTRPSILDFLVALFGGMSGAALISLRRHVFHYLPGAVIGITLLPALCVMGFGLGDTLGGQLFTGGGLQFTANVFAAVLGAGVILTLVGIPQASQCESVRQWKEQELARPLVRAVFGRLKLQTAIGRTGSVRARLVVVGIFLLLLLIPLQTAFDQLTLEFRTRQAIARAQGVFDIPGRSAVLGSSFTVRQPDVEVRIQVATNELFTSADIARFQERVTDQLGRPTHLDLVQTLSDVGQADTIRGMLFARANPPPAQERGRTLAESLQDLKELIGQTVAALPLPDTFHLVTTRSDLSRPGGPAIEIVYLADAELGTDARSMVTRLLAERARVGEGRVSLHWVAAAHRVGVSRAGAVNRADAPRLRELRSTLAEHPGLVAVLELPPGLSAKAGAEVHRQIQQELGLAGLSVVRAGEDAEPRVAVIRLELTSDASS